MKHIKQIKKKESLIESKPVDSQFGLPFQLVIPKTHSRKTRHTVLFES